MPPFQFNSKSAFLTYPQLENITNESVKEDYLVFANNLKVDKYCIGVEKHQDGGIHLHCFLSWTEAFRSRDAKCFDFVGNHPNIQNPRNRTDVIRYCSKDGDFLSNIQTTSSKRKYGELLTESTSIDEFCKAVETNYPRDYILYNKRIKDFATDRWKGNGTDYQSIHTEWSIPTELNSWVESYLSNIQGKPTLHSATANASATFR